MTNIDFLYIYPIELMRTHDLVLKKYDQHCSIFRCDKCGWTSQTFTLTGNPYTDLWAWALRGEIHVTRPENIMSCDEFLIKSIIE
jgi:hypothetical protein